MIAKNKLTDKQLLFCGSVAGYLLTALVLICAMRFQIGAFKLAGILSLPFALSSYLIGEWLSPKISQAKTLQKSIFTSILAATLTSLLTGALTGLASAILEAQKQTAPQTVSFNIWVVSLYVVIGFLYSTPGILIVGTLLGKKIYQRNHP